MRYTVAIIGGLVAILIVGLLQSVVIGQMFDGIRKPDRFEAAVFYIGQLALPLAAGAWVFLRTARSSR